tara:strand:+ start:36 stop:896 length:861 start_codon:yes stop_codon:yes gene_type:complete
MNENGWVDADGNPDYLKAFGADRDLRLAIAQLEELMIKRGFPLKGLEDQLKAIQNERLLNENFEGRDGDQIEMTIIDQLFINTAPDIKMDLYFHIGGGGMKKQLDYQLKAIDTYSSKTISSTSGVGPGSSSSDISTLIMIAVKDNMDNFCLQLTDHFHKQLEVGREINIQVKVNNEDVFLDDYYYCDSLKMDDEELATIIDGWLFNNSKGGMYQIASSSPKQMKINSIRVPIIDENNKAVTAKTFSEGLVRILRKYIKDEDGNKFKIKSTIQNLGVGEAWIIIGNK